MVAQPAGVELGFQLRQPGFRVQGAQHHLIPPWDQLLKLFPIFFLLNRLWLYQNCLWCFINYSSIIVPTSFVRHFYFYVSLMEIWLVSNNRSMLGNKGPKSEPVSQGPAGALSWLHPSFKFHLLDPISFPPPYFLNPRELCSESPRVVGELHANLHLLGLFPREPNGRPNVNICLHLLWGARIGIHLQLWQILRVQPSILSFQPGHLETIPLC